MAQQSRTREPAFACFAIAILYFVSGTALETDPIRQTTGDYFLYETDAGRGNIGASLDQSDDGSIAWGYANLGAISTEMYDLTKTEGASVEWDARALSGLPSTAGTSGGVLVSVTDGTTVFAAPQTLTVYQLAASTNSMSWERVFALSAVAQATQSRAGPLNLLLPPVGMPGTPERVPSLSGGSPAAARLERRTWRISAVAVASSIRQHDASLASATAALQGSPPMPAYPSTSSTPLGVTPAAVLVACSAPAFATATSAGAPTVVPAYSWVAVLQRVPASAPACPRPSSGALTPVTVENVVNASVCVLEDATAAAVAAAFGDNTRALQAAAAGWAWKRVQILFRNSTVATTQAIFGRGLDCYAPGLAAGAPGATSASAAAAGPLCAVGDPEANTVALWAPRAAALLATSASAAVGGYVVNSVDGSMLPLDPPGGPSPSSFTQAASTAAALGLDWPSPWAALASITISTASERFDALLAEGSTLDTTTIVAAGLPPTVSLPPFELSASLGNASATTGNGWGFGFSVAVSQHHVVVGAPGAGLFGNIAGLTINRVAAPYFLGTTVSGQSYGSPQSLVAGRASGGAVWVFDLPSAGTEASAHAFALFSPHGGGNSAQYAQSANVASARAAQRNTGITALSSATQLSLVCRLSGDALGGLLGWHVAAAQDPTGSSLSVVAAAPRAGYMVLSTVNTQARTCKRQISVTGFQSTSVGPDSTGTTVSISGGISYVAGPTADNSRLGGSPQPGRLFVKTWCDPHRGAIVPSNGLTRYCFACPAGTDNIVGDLTYASPSTLCTACGGGIPGSVFLPAYGCVWACSRGLFGSSCSVCSSFMRTLTSSSSDPVNITIPGQPLSSVVQASLQSSARLPLTNDAALVVSVSVVRMLAANAVWVDIPSAYPANVTQVRHCVWTCIEGYTVNKSAVVLLPPNAYTTTGTAPGTLVLGLRPNVPEAISTACIPPPPPSRIAAVAVLGLPGQQCRGGEGRGACYNDSAPLAITSSSVSLSLFLPNSTTVAAAASRLRTALLFNRSLSFGKASPIGSSLPYWSLVDGSGAGISSTLSTPPLRARLVLSGTATPMSAFDSDGDAFVDEMAGAAWPVSGTSGQDDTPSASLLCLANPSCKQLSSNGMAWGQWKRLGWGDGTSSDQLQLALFQNASLGGVISPAVPLELQLWSPVRTLPLGATACNNAMLNQELCAGADSALLIDTILPSSSVLAPPPSALVRAQAAVASATGASMAAITAASSPYSALGACNSVSATSGTQIGVGLGVPGPCSVPATLIVNGLRSGISYCVATAAGNVGGWGQFSPPAPQRPDAGVATFSLLPAVPAFAPGPPIQTPLAAPLVATNAPRGGLLNISWPASADLGGGAQLGFEVCLVSVSGNVTPALNARIAAGLRGSPTLATLSSLCTIMVVRGRGSLFAQSNLVSRSLSYAWPPNSAPNLATAAYAAGWPTTNSSTTLSVPSVPSLCTGYGLGYRFGWPAVVAAFTNASLAGRTVNTMQVSAILSQLGGLPVDALEVSPEGWDGNLGLDSGVFITGLPAGSRWVGAVRIFTAGGASNYSLTSSGAAPLVASDASPPSAITPTWWVAASSDSNSSQTNLNWGIACDGSAGGRAFIRWGRPAATGGLPLSYRVWLLVDANIGTANATVVRATDSNATNAAVGDFVEVFSWGADDGVLDDSSVVPSRNVTLAVALRVDVPAPSPVGTPLLAHAPCAVNITGLDANSTYRIRIVALNAAGASPVSDAAGISLGVCVTGPALLPPRSPRLLAPPLPELVSVAAASISSRGDVIAGSSWNASSASALRWDPTGLGFVPNGSWSIAASSFRTDRTIANFSGVPSIAAISPSSLRVVFWPPADAAGAAITSYRVQVSIQSPPSVVNGVPGTGSAPVMGFAGFPALATASAANFLGLGGLSDALLLNLASASTNSAETLRRTIVDLRASVRATYDVPAIPSVLGRPAGAKSFAISGLSAGSTVCVSLAAVTPAGMSPWSSEGASLDASLPITAWAGLYAGLATASAPAAAINSLNCTWCTTGSSRCPIESEGAFWCPGASALTAPAISSKISSAAITAAVSATTIVASPRVCASTPQQPTPPSTAPFLGMVSANALVLTPISATGTESLAHAAGFAFPAQVAGTSTGGAMGTAVSGYDDDGRTAEGLNASSATLMSWETWCSTSALSAPWTSNVLPNGSVLAPLWMQPCVNPTSTNLLARLYRDFGITVTDIHAIANPAIVTSGSAQPAGRPVPVSSAVLSPSPGASVFPGVDIFASASILRLLCALPVDTGGSPIVGLYVETLLIASAGSAVLGNAWTVAPIALQLSASALAGDGSAAVWRTLARLQASGATLSSLSVTASTTLGNGSDTVHESVLNTTSSFFSLSNSSGWGPLRHDALFSFLSAGPLAQSLALPPWAVASQDSNQGAPVRWLLPPAVVQSANFVAETSGSVNFSSALGPAGEPMSVVVISGLLADSTYSIRVSTVTAAGVGPVSTAIRASTGPSSAPGSPGTPRIYFGFSRRVNGESVRTQQNMLPLVASAGPVRSSSVDLAWAAPIDAGGVTYGVLTYEVYAFVQRADVSASRQTLASMGLAVAACDAVCFSGGAPASVCNGSTIAAPPADPQTGYAIVSNNSVWTRVGSTGPGITSMRVMGLRASTTYAFAVVPVGARGLRGSPSRALLNVTTAPVSPPSAPPLLFVADDRATLRPAVTVMARTQSELDIFFTEAVDTGGAPVAGYRVLLAAIPKNRAAVYIGGLGMPGIAAGVNGSVDADATSRMTSLLNVAYPGMPVVPASALEWVAVADVIVNSTALTSSAGCTGADSPWGQLVEQTVIPTWNSSLLNSSLPSELNLAAAIYRIATLLSSVTVTRTPVTSFQLTPGVYVVTPNVSYSPGGGPQRFAVTVGSLAAATSYAVRLVAWGTQPGSVIGSTNAVFSNSSESWASPASALLCVSRNGLVYNSALCPTATTPLAQVPSQPGEPFLATNGTRVSSLDLIISPPSLIGGVPIVAYRVAVSTDPSVPGNSVAVFVSPAAAACSAELVTPGSTVATLMGLAGHSPSAIMPPLEGAIDSDGICTVLSPAGTSSGNITVRVLGLLSNTSYWCTAIAINEAGWSVPSTTGGPFTTLVTTTAVPLAPVTLSAIPTDRAYSSYSVVSQRKAEEVVNSSVECSTGEAALNSSLGDAVDSFYAVGVSSNGSDFLTIAWETPDSGVAPIVAYLVSWLRVARTGPQTDLGGWDALCKWNNASMFDISECGGITFLPLSSPALLLSTTVDLDTSYLQDDAAVARGIWAVASTSSSFASDNSPVALNVYRVAALAANSTYIVSVRPISQAGVGNAAFLVSQTNAGAAPGPIPATSIIVSLASSMLLSLGSSKIPPQSIDAVIAASAPDLIAAQWSAPLSSGGSPVNSFLLEWVAVVNAPAAVGTSATNALCTNASDGTQFRYAQAPWCYPGAPASATLHLRALINATNASCGMATSSVLAVIASYLSGGNCSASHRYLFLLSALDVAAAYLSNSSSSAPFVLTSSNGYTSAPPPLPPSTWSLGISPINSAGFKGVVTTAHNPVGSKTYLVAGMVSPPASVAASLLTWPSSVLSTSSARTRNSLLMTPQVPPWCLSAPNCDFFSCANTTDLRIPAPGTTPPSYAVTGSPVSPWIAPTAILSNFAAATNQWLALMSPGILGTRLTSYLSRAELGLPVYVTALSYAKLGVVWRWACPQNRVGTCDRLPGLSFLVSVQRVGCSSTVCRNSLGPLLPAEQLLSFGPIANTTAITNATSYGVIVDDLSGGSTYSVSVAAVFSSGGVGPWSPPVLTTLPAPPVAGRVNASNSITSLGSGFLDVNVGAVTEHPSLPLPTCFSLLHLGTALGLYALPPTSPFASFRSNASTIYTATAPSVAALMNYSIHPLSAALAAQQSLITIASGGSRSNHPRGAYISSSTEPTFAVELPMGKEASLEALAAFPSSLGMLLDVLSSNLPPASPVKQVNAALWSTVFLGSVRDDNSAGIRAGHAGCINAQVGVTLPSTLTSFSQGVVSPFFTEAGLDRISAQSTAAIAATTLAGGISSREVTVSGLADSSSPSPQRLVGLPSDAVIIVAATRIDLTINTSAVMSMLVNLAAAFATSAFSNATSMQQTWPYPGGATSSTPSYSSAVLIPPASDPKTIPTRVRGRSSWSFDCAVVAIMSDAVTVQWTPPADSGGRPILAYVVQAAPLSTVVSNESTTPSVDARGLVSTVVTYTSWSRATYNASALVRQLPPMLPPISVTLNNLTASIAYVVRFAGFSGLDDDIFIQDAHSAAITADTRARSALANFSTSSQAIEMLLAEQAALVSCNLTWWDSVAPVGLGPFSDWTARFTTNPPSPPQQPSPPWLVTLMSPAGAPVVPLGAVTSSTVSLSWLALPSSALSGTPLLFYRLHIRTVDGSPALPALAESPSNNVVLTHNALPVATVLAATGGKQSIPGVRSPLEASSSSISVVAGCGTSYTVTGLAAETQYQFAVSAVNIAGDSGISAWSAVITTARAALSTPVGAPVATAAIVSSSIMARLCGVSPVSSALVMLNLPVLSGGLPLSHFVVKVTAVESNTTTLLVLSATDVISAGDIVVSAHATLQQPIPASIISAVEGVQSTLVGWSANSRNASSAIVLGSLPALSASGSPRYAAFLLRSLNAATTYTVAVYVANTGGLSSVAALNAATTNRTICNFSVDTSRWTNDTLPAILDVCVGPLSTPGIASRWPSIGWAATTPLAWSLAFTTASTPLPPTASLPPIWLTTGLSAGTSDASTLDLAILRPTEFGGATVSGYVLQLSGDAGMTWGGDRLIRTSADAVVQAASSEQLNSTGGGIGAGIRGVPIRNVVLVSNSSGQAPLPWPATVSSPGGLGGVDSLAFASGAAAVYGIPGASLSSLAAVNSSLSASYDPSTGLPLSSAGLPWQLAPAVYDSLFVTPSLLGQWYAGVVLLSLGSLDPVPMPGIPVLPGSSAVNKTAILAAAGASITSDATMFESSGSLGGSEAAIGAGDGDACGLAEALVLASSASSSSSALPDWLPFGNKRDALPSLTQAASPCVHVTARVTMLYGVGASFLVRVAAVSTPLNAAPGAVDSDWGAPGSLTADAAWSAVQPVLELPGPMSPAPVLPPLPSNDSCLSSSATAALEGFTLAAALAQPPVGRVTSSDVPLDHAGGVLPMLALSDSLTALLNTPVAQRLAFGSYSRASALAAETPAAASPSGPVQGLAVDVHAPTLLGISWLPPLALGGGAPLCYRVEVALDGFLADACSLAMTAVLGYDATAGFVTSISPPPLQCDGFGCGNSSGCRNCSALFAAGSVPALGAWQQGMPGPKNVSNATLAAAAAWAKEALDPSGTGSVLVRSANGSAVTLPISQFLGFTSQSLEQIGLAAAADSYTPLKLPFGPGFNSSSRMNSGASANAVLPSSASSVGEWMVVQCVAAPALPPTPVPFIPVSESLAAARVSASLIVPPGAMLRVRVTAVTGAVALAPSSAPALSLTAAASAGPVVSGGGRRAQQTRSTSEGGHTGELPPQARQAQATAAEPYQWVASGPLLAPWPPGASSGPSASGTTGTPSPELLVITPAAPPPSPPPPVLGSPAPNSSAITVAVQLRSGAGGGWTGGCGLTRTALFRAQALSAGVFGPESLVWASDDSAIVPPASNASSWRSVLDAGLLRASLYRYRTSVRNAVGWSLPSAALLVSTSLALASPPLGLTVLAAQMLPVTVPLSWLPPADDGGAAATAFYVQYAALGALRFDAGAAALASGALAWTRLLYVPLSGLVVSNASTAPASLRYAYNVSGLAPSSRYILRVAAVTAPTVGVGAWSSLVNATTPDPLPCPGLPDPASPAARNGSDPNAGRGRCSGHGACSQWDGTCSCDAGYGDPDCAFQVGLALSAVVDVPLAAFSASAFSGALALVVNASVGPGTGIPVPGGVSVPFSASRFLVLSVTPAVGSRRLREGKPLVSAASAESALRGWRNSNAGSSNAGSSSDTGGSGRDSAPLARRLAVVKPSPLAAAPASAPDAAAHRLSCSAALALAVSAAEWPSDLPTPALLSRTHACTGNGSCTRGSSDSARFGFNAETGEATLYGGPSSSGQVTLQACYEQYAASADAPSAADSEARSRRVSATAPPPSLAVEFMILLTAAEQGARAAALAASGGVMAYAAAVGGGDALAVPPPPLSAIPGDPSLPTPTAYAALQSAAAAQLGLLTSAGVEAIQFLTSSQGTLLSPPPARVTLPPVPVCASATTCAACLASPACGWCASTAACSLGLPSLPTYAACPAGVSPGAADGSELTWGPAGSAVPLYFHELQPLPLRATCAAECSSLGACEACTHRADCGWCEASQSCVRSADLAAGAACGNASSGGVWLSSDAQCPSLRCPPRASAAQCLSDRYCGFCSMGSWPASLGDFCGPGDAFGFIGDSYAGRCATGRYYFRSLGTSCTVRQPSSASSSPCGVCRAQGGGGVCGWCQSRVECGVAASFGSPSGPAFGTCPPSSVAFEAPSNSSSSASPTAATAWFGPSSDGACPALPVTPRSQCAGKTISGCGACVTAGVGCAFCDTTLSGGSPSCMLLGDALGLDPALAGTYDSFAAATCPASAALRGLPQANYSYGNGTLSLPGYAVPACAETCSSTSTTRTAAAGFLQVGSAGDPANPIVPLVYRPSGGLGASCQWLLCPYSAVNGSGTSGGSSFSQVRLQFSAWDLRPLDYVAVCPNVATTPTDSGCSTVLQGSSSGSGVSMSISSGCVTVILVTHAVVAAEGAGTAATSLGTGFRMTWSGVNPPPGIDVILLIVAITSGSLLVVCCSLYIFFKVLKRIRRRNRNPFGDEPTETLADAQALAARRGRAVPACVTSRFPVFVYDADKVEQTPLRAAPRSAQGSPEPASADARDVVENTATQCAVCLCDFETGDIVRLLPCRHAFHRDCIDPALGLSRACPNCRADTVVLQAARERLLLRLTAGGPDVDAVVDPLAFGAGITLLPPPPPAPGEEDLEEAFARLGVAVEEEGEGEDEVDEEEEDLDDEEEDDVPRRRGGSRRPLTDAGGGGSFEGSPEHALADVTNPMRLRGHHLQHQQLASQALGNASNRRVVVRPTTSASWVPQTHHTRSGYAFSRPTQIPSARRRAALARRERVGDVEVDEDGFEVWPEALATAAAAASLDEEAEDEGSGNDGGPRLLVQHGELFEMYRNPLRDGGGSRGRSVVPRGSAAQAQARSRILLQPHLLSSGVNDAPESSDAHAHPRAIVARPETGRAASPRPSRSPASLRSAAAAAVGSLSSHAHASDAPETARAARGLSLSDSDSLVFVSSPLYVEEP